MKEESDEKGPEYMWLLAKSDIGVGSDAGWESGGITQGVWAGVVRKSVRSITDHLFEKILDKVQQKGSILTELLFFL